MDGKPGRPPIYLTPEAKAKAERQARARSKAKTKNITVDAEIVTILNDAQDRLEQEFGFRPSQSQVLRYLLKKVVP